MALHTTTSVYAYRTASVPSYNAAWSATWWVRLTSASLSIASLLVVGNSLYAEEDIVELNSAVLSGTSVGNGGYASTGGAAVSAGTWYYVAMVRESSTALKLYIGTESTAAALVGTATRDISSRAAATYLGLGTRTTSGDDKTPGDYDSLKIWSVALTAGEVEAERLYEGAQKSTGKWAVYTLQSNVTDTGGSGRNLTAVGIATYVTGPAINRGVVPGQVTGLTATAASASQINLSWTAPSGAISYKVERSPNGSSSWTQITSAITATSYSNTGLSTGTTYYYRVRATNASGDGAYSGTASATTSGGWGYTDVYRETLDRYQPILITATGGTGYIGATEDVAPDGSSTWRWFAGPLGSDGVTLTEAASEAAARSSALALPTSASGRWDLPATVEARTVRLGWQGAFTLREYYAERVVEGDLIRAGSVKTLHLAAGAVTADKITAATLSAISANMGTVTAGTITGATIRTNDTTTRVELSGSGLQVLSSGVTRVLLDTNGLKTYSASGTVQVEATTATNGALKAGAGAVSLDAAGLRIAIPALDSATTNAIGWTDGTDTPVTLLTWAPVGSFPWRAIWHALGTSGRQNTEIEILAQSYAGAAGQINLSSTPQVVIQANPAGGSGGFLSIEDARAHLANVGLYLGALAPSTVPAGQIHAAGLMRIMDTGLSPSTGSSLEIHYDTNANVGRIFAYNRTGSAPRGLAIQHPGGNTEIGTSGSLLAVNTSATAGQTVRVRAVGATNATYALVLVDSADANLFYVVNDGNAWLRGTLTQASDARRKRDIAAIADGLGPILALRPTTYRRDGPTESGLIAQEVAAIPALQHLVSTDAEGGLGINYLGLLAYMIRAIQQLAEG